MNQEEFFQANQVDGQLTDAQMGEMLSLAEGDTGSKQPESGEPSTTSNATEAATTVETADETQGDAPKVVEGAPVEDLTPVLLAKDGVHTIDYQKLVDAREGEKTWKAAAEAAQQQLAALQAQAQQRADDGAAPTAADGAVATATAAIESGVDPEIFGDFSEQAIAKGIQKLVSSGLDALRSELNQVVAPIKATNEKTAIEVHTNTIYDAHPDADSIAESAELSGWINKQPSFVRDGYKAVLAQGTASQVVELFSAFKDATGKTAATPGKTDVAAAAKAAIANARQAPPTSLSEIPAASAAHHDEAAAMLEMSSASLSSRFEGKTPEQIHQLMNNIL